MQSQLSVVCVGAYIGLTIDYLNNIRIWRCIQTASTGGRYYSYLVYLRQV